MSIRRDPDFRYYQFWLTATELVPQLRLQSELCASERLTMVHGIMYGVM